MSRVWPQDQQEMGWPGAPNDDAWPADHGRPSGAGEQAGADGSGLPGRPGRPTASPGLLLIPGPRSSRVTGSRVTGSGRLRRAAGATGTDPYAPGTSSTWPGSSRSSGAADAYAADPYAAGTGSSGAGSGQADGAGSWYGAPVASDVTPSSPAAVPGRPARPAHGTVGSGGSGEPGGSPAGNGDGDDGMGWYRHPSGSGPAASGANWPGEDEAGDERSSRLSRRSRWERDQKPGARRGRRARPEPDSDPGAPAGTGFACPGGTVSSPSGYGPGPAREIGEITAFQPPAPPPPGPRAPVTVRPPPARPLRRGPRLRPARCPHRPAGFRRLRHPGPPRRRQWLALRRLHRDQRRGARRHLVNAHQRGMALRHCAQRRHLAWRLARQPGHRLARRPRIQAHRRGWPACRLGSGFRCDRRFRHAGIARSAQRRLAWQPGSGFRRDRGLRCAWLVRGRSARRSPRTAFLVAGGRGQRLHCRLARLGPGPGRGHRFRPWLRGCLTQRVAWRRWWPAWRSGSGLWRDGLWRDCRL